MKRAAGAALLAAAALAQVTWAPRVEVGGAFPNLVLLGVVAVTWTLGARSGMVWACLGGLLLDLTSSGPVGPHALALVPGAYLIAFWIRNLEHATALHVALTAAVSTLIYSAVLVLTDELIGISIPTLSVAAELALAAAVYNALLTPLALELLRRLQALTHLRTEPA